MHEENQSKILPFGPIALDGLSRHLPPVVMPPVLMAPVSMTPGGMTGVPPVDYSHHDMDAAVLVLSTAATILNDIARSIGHTDAENRAQQILDLIAPLGHGPQ